MYPTYGLLIAPVVVHTVGEYGRVFNTDITGRHSRSLLPWFREAFEGHSLLLRTHTQSR